MGVPSPRRSLETEAAREDGVWTMECFGVLGVGSEGKADTGCLAIGSGAARFRPMIVVSSFLNRSRSLWAMAGGEVNVKLCPASSFTSPSFSRTCAAPSLLQNRAVWMSVNMGPLFGKSKTCRQLQHVAHGLKEPSGLPESIVDVCL
jgi:hypothetical protein